MLLLIILSLAGYSLAFGSIQSVAVTGILECNGKPVTDAKLKLYDDEALGMWELEERKETNETGGFRLSYSKEEISTIDPVLFIYHKCNHGGCYRELFVEIPKSSVSQGNTPEKTFNIGTINLASEFKGEDTRCWI